MRQREEGRRKKEGEKCEREEKKRERIVGGWEQGSGERGRDIEGEGGRKGEREQ